jgi:hypothetical protein
MYVWGVYVWGTLHASITCGWVVATYGGGHDGATAVAESRIVSAPQAESRLVSAPQKPKEPFEDVWLGVVPRTFGGLPISRPESSSAACTHARAIIGADRRRRLVIEFCGAKFESSGTRDQRSHLQKETTLVPSCQTALECLCLTTFAGCFDAGLLSELSRSVCG